MRIYGIVRAVPAAGRRYRTERFGSGRPDMISLSLVERTASFVLTASLQIELAGENVYTATPLFGPDIFQKEKRNPDPETGKNNGRDQACVRP